MDFCPDLSDDFPLGTPLTTGARFVRCGEIRFKGTGRAYVFSGADGSQLYVFNGENKEDGFGPGRGVGDVNGDGYGDLVIAAYMSEAGGARKAGRGYVFSGKNGAVLRTMTSRVKGDLRRIAHTNLRLRLIPLFEW